MAVTAAFKGAPQVARLVTGLVGDGVTDDSGVIQAAVTRAAAASSGQTIVQLPAGTFAVDTRIELADGVVLQGQGIGKTTIKAIAGIASAVIVGLGASTVTDAAVRDMTVNANTQGVNGVQVSSGARIIIERVKVQNAAVGVNLPTTTDSVVRHCFIDTCTSQGVFLSGAGCRVESCVISGCADSGVYSTGADTRVINTTVSDAGSTGANKHGVCLLTGASRSMVRGCKLTPSGGMGIFADGVTDVVIDGNYINNSGSTLECIGLSAASVRGRIVGNTCLNGVDNGISVSADSCTVAGNVVDTCNFMGIQINAADHVTVTGNTVKNAGQTGGATAWAGIDIYNSTHCAVTGNRCHDDQGTKTQVNGIAERGASANYNAIVGNVATDNATSSVVTLGANTVSTGNVT